MTTLLPLYVCPAEERHHPVVRMWRGHEEALVRYGLDVCAVWTANGRADTVVDTLRAEFSGPVRT